MKKRLIAVLFVIMLCLCTVFSACGDSPEYGDSTDGNGTGYGQGDENGEITQMYIYVNDSKLTVTLEQNSSVEALLKILEQGDITYTAYANNFEIYGDIGQELPTDDKWITSQSGDVLLWAKSNICIFFGNNSYSYTRIGKIEGYTSGGLKEILAQSDSVRVTVSLK